MPAPILATKLFIPPPRPSGVPRPRLIGRLNEGLHRKLTLVSAPAGFGKTTLVGEWVASGERPVAWLSLDEGDNDPTRFLAYLVAAVQTVEANVARGVLDVLDSPQPPPTESILTALINDLTTLPNEISLVLDDCHVIEAEPVVSALAFLLDHLPPQVHLIIATREDPPLPLARYRGRDQLTELRVTDLRFSPSEAAEFLNRVMGLNLPAEAISLLDTRTEGWIAGLQLAAISMRGHDDPADFITSFTGSHHLVMDYLIEEVLQQQSERLQRFLLRTSILDRLCGSLCDAVLQDPTGSGHETLVTLERANLLVVPLDDKREWYRYHHLFAEVLQVRLRKEHPDEVAVHHLRACAWCEEHDLRAEAIRYALAAGDVERAAMLIELDWSDTSGSHFRNATWLGWVKTLPDALVRSRPRLSVGLAWELLFSGELEAAEARMRDADRLLTLTAEPTDPHQALSTGGGGGADDPSRSLRASLAIGRAFHAQSLGDGVGTEHHARRALTLVSEADLSTRGHASSLLGLACLTRGDLEAAYTHLAAGMAILRTAGNLLFATSGTFVLADIRVAQGRLLDATRIYEEALRDVTARGEPVGQGAADLVLGLSELYRERGDEEAADQHLLRGEELGERAALLDWPFPLCLAQAHQKRSRGDYDGALELLDEAERLHYRTPVPDVRPIGALRARLWLEQGRLTEALGWAQRRGLSAHDDLSYLREFEHVTLARILIALYRRDRSERTVREAAGLLERLLGAAEEGGRMGSVIEILVLQALAHEARGNIPLALVPLERALALGEPEGYVTVFVDEGPPMVELLTRMQASREGGKPVANDVVDRYVHVLLAAVGTRVEDRSPAGHRPSIAPLSRREMEVLQLIAQGCSNAEIGDRLFLALDTVKGHNRKIFDKLEVRRRTEAVARARELGLLQP